MWRSSWRISGSRAGFIWIAQAYSVLGSAGIMHCLTKFDHGFAKLPASVVLVIRELAQRVRTGEVDESVPAAGGKADCQLPEKPMAKCFKLLDPS